MEIDEAKTEFNAKAKASMDDYLRAKSWKEKIESIERMNVADRIAKEAMRRALAAERARKDAQPAAGQPAEPL